MPRSPRLKRAKGRAVSDKRKLERSLSYTRSPLPPSPGDCPLTSTAATSKPTTTMDITDIEKAVATCLSGDAFINKLVVKLTENVRNAVVDALSQSLREARAEIDGLKKTVVTLKTELRTVENKASVRWDELEQYQRRNNLRVFGIPETQGEDTDGIVLGLLNKKLGVDLPLDRVERSHRVGKPRPPGDDGKPRPRPVIIRFLSYRDRREIFGKKRSLKGTGITLREDLTPRRAEVLRKAVELYGQKNVWTIDGRIIWEVAGGARRVATTIEDLK